MAAIRCVSQFTNPVSRFALDQRNDPVEIPVSSQCEILASGEATDFVQDNVVIVITDDQGYGDMAFTGKRLMPTESFIVEISEGIKGVI